MGNFTQIEREQLLLINQNKRVISTNLAEQKSESHNQDWDLVGKNLSQATKYDMDVIESIHNIICDSRSEYVEVIC